MLRLATLLAAFLTLTATAFARDYKLGDLVIDHPVARATAPGAKVGGGYLKITNTGAKADRLIGAKSAFSDRVEIHEMKMDGDVMKMRALQGGLVIEPGATAVLAPGGNHIMFMGLTETLATGEHRKVTLEFEQSGQINVMFQVKSIAETMKLKEGATKMDHGKTDHGDEKHDNHEQHGKKKDHDH